MATNKITEKLRANVVLLTSGEREVNVSLGSLHAASYNGDKVLAVASALVPCLDGNFSKCEIVETSRLEEE